MSEVSARPVPPALAGPGLRPGVSHEVPNACRRRDARGWDEPVFRWCRPDGDGSCPRSWCRGPERSSALALLVTRVGADHHDPAVPADNPALVADPLDARLDLHGVCLTSRPTTPGHALAHPAPGREPTNKRPVRCLAAPTGRGTRVSRTSSPDRGTVLDNGRPDRQLTCSGRRCARGSGRTATTRRRPGPRAGCGCSADASCR
jgi:hypothetical protein